MKQKSKHFLLLMLLSAGLFLGTILMPRNSSAIPAFAEKFHFSCAVCHTVFPNLNPFGRAFWRNGFRLPGTNGTPADATQVAQGLSLPNPWPIPIAIETVINYRHATNENIPANATGGGIVTAGATDNFTASLNMVAAGAFKLYTPLSNSLSFYVHFGQSHGSPTAMGLILGWASLNGIGSGFGIPSHLVNLKAGLLTTASPYFYRQDPNTAAGNTVQLANGPVQAGQGLNVGYDGEAGALIHGSNTGGFGLYGTPGYHLWYKVTVTNDPGSPSSGASNAEALVGGTHSNAMAYTYQLKEYAPIPMGQLEFGYYGATVAEPISVNNESWTNRVAVNGVDIDLANDIYELGLTYMVQSDSNPYGSSNAALPSYIQDTSNGYSTFEVYGRYLLPQIGKGVMLSADYAQYSWTHEQTQKNFNAQAANGNCANLYQNGSYTEVNGGCNEGIKNSLLLEAQYNLAYNAHIYLGYDITNQTEDNILQTGLDFAF
jgi:hypothetical protein